jgi:KUP system potassium uptake protein
VPPALLHNLKHNKVVHERIVLLTLVVEDVPYIEDNDRVRVQDLGSNFFRVVAQYGFKEDPNVPKILEHCHPHGLDFNEMETTFFLGRETLIRKIALRNRLAWHRGGKSYLSACCVIHAVQPTFSAFPAIG